MIIAVDFDGTIVEHAYPKIGRPIPFAIETLKKIQSELHHQLILWTVREGELLDEAVAYCRENGIEFYAINNDFREEQRDSKGWSRKIKVDLFIDDRNLGGMPDWGLVYDMLLTGAYRGGNIEEILQSAAEGRKARGRSRRKRNIFQRIGDAIEKREKRTKRK